MSNAVIEKLKLLVQQQKNTGYSTSTQSLSILQEPHRKKMWFNIDLASNQPWSSTSPEFNIVDTGNKWG